MLTMIEVLKAILFGVVEGITEWLPISSTGHMILLDEFVKLNVSPEFLDLFLVVIQLGAILAVVVIYWNKLIPLSTKHQPQKMQNVGKDHRCIYSGRSGWYLMGRCIYKIFLQLSDRSNHADSGGYCIYYRRAFQ